MAESSSSPTSPFTIISTSTTTVHKTLLFCPSSSLQKNERMGVSSVPSSTPSSSLSSSSIVSSPGGGGNYNTTQHPPIVHAIGGAVGSALAILLFYPLERVRIELQSNVAGSSNSSNSTASGEIIERENDDDTNILHRQPTYPIDNLSNENNVSIIKGEVDKDNIIPTAPVLERSTSPSSYEIISSVKSTSLEDAASLGTLSNEVPLDNSESSSTPLVVESEDSEPSILSSSSSDDGSTTTILPQSATATTQPQQQKSNESMKQCLRRLYTEKSLYKGASHMVLTWMISNAIFFYALQVTRDQLSSSSSSLVGKNEQLTMKKSLLASTIAGCINVVLTNPLWVACVRVLEDRDCNTTSLSQLHLWTVMYQISHKEGIGQLWNGTATSLLLVSNPIIQHFVYEQLRSWFIKRKQTQLLVIRKRSSGSRMKYQEGRGGSTRTTTLSPMEAFLCGALSKALATGLTYPLQLAQTLLRLQKKNKSELNDDNEEFCYTGTLDCLCKQYSMGGIPALFYGMNTKLLQTCLTAAFQFVTYESILTPFGRLYAAAMK